ncbi:MAG: hypothetical protein LBR79_00195 [Oscillospiraceae bacterium]|nr:hypothetical protein [Oscillospiraceae bacterium]
MGENFQHCMPHRECKQLFGLVNGAMVLICAGTMWMNYVGTNVVNSSYAVSEFGGDRYEYRSEGENFCEIKNGKTVGSINLGKNYKFTKNILSLKPCAAGVGVAALASGIGVAATGGGFAAAAAAAGAVGANAVNTIVGGAVAVGAAVAPVAAPGAVAVEATLGGAGLAAAEAAVAPAAMGAAATGALAAVGGAVFAGAVLT